MGFSTLIDILGSIVIGGMLLMILLRLNDAAVHNSFTFNGDAIVQRNLVEIVQLLEYDFRKIAYTANWENQIDRPDAIILADSTIIAFRTDIDSDGIVDILTYYLGPESELSNTPNPRDRMLYRSVNGGTPLGANLGVTRFNLSYYNVFGNKIPMPVLPGDTGEIESIHIDLVVEDVSAYDNDYSKTAWRQIRLAARNLNNR